MDSKKAYELMTDEKKETTIDGLGVVEIFETEYPELAEEYKPGS